ncbi:DUF262 domain-containing protein [Actinoplanes sp. NBRC 103695]|uniref:DUF262 domain-containing protein n=1 Tax=Actinoplanes sp. NBRC 103695 TaxID=3032202 RepID=UPI0025525334|nr:DUF262 domain-containing protein [Actinoplanes sp. NBRC 103695]
MAGSQTQATEHKSENSDPCFLGGAVLVKAEGDAAAEVVDGQQRLTTSTTLSSMVACRPRTASEGSPGAPTGIVAAGRLMFGRAAR